MTTIRHGGPCGLRIEMRSAEREEKSVVFHATEGRMVFATRSEGGCGRIPAQGVAKPLSAICLIPLWLSAVNRPARFRRGRKAGTRATPPKAGGHVTPIAVLSGIPLSGPMGSLSSSFIPAGRLRIEAESRCLLVETPPLSPRASSCRIGPRRQGFASPLRALDCSGPIRKTRCLRGERGVRAVGCGGR